MALRMTGMFSGLDTQSIIQELVAARQTKVDKQKKAQTALSWKQDAWKELNAKLKNLMNKTISNLRFSSSYSKKTTKVSDSTVASIITGENAVNGVQSLQVKQMAKTAYLTGAEIKGKDGKELTALSKLSDIDGFNVSGEGTFTVKTGNKSVDIKVTEDTTISDVLTQLKNAGLNASFDAKNGRMFVSAKESGAANDFSIVASDENGVKALSALGILTDDKATRAEYEKWAAYYTGDKTGTLANMQSMIDATVASKTNSYLEQYKSTKAAADAAEAKIKELKDKNLQTVEDYQKALEDKAKEIEKLQDEMKDTSLSPEQMREKEEKLLELQKEMTTLNADKADAENLKTQEKNLAAYQEQMKSISEYVTVSESVDSEGNVTYSATATAKLTEEVGDSYYQKAQYAAEVVSGGFEALKASEATKIDGQDAEIYLNGAKFTSSGNTFDINGLTITVQRETANAGEPGGETITITTDDDTDGIYDMIKSFLKEYNEIVNEMDKLYNADSAGSYEPLTDEEKEALSESEIEKYEQKIKDSLLRRDDNLSTVNSALQSIMSAGVTVNGKTMHLYDFGIDVLGYFNAADNEKHAYHIDGDSDDEFTSGNADKLKTMISNDPDTVISFFTQLSRNLYSKMDELSKSRDGYRSYGNFYDDKKMQSDYDDYTKKIADLEAKLADYEDMWYKKFSKMETALAKLQSNVSAVTSLLGG